MRTTGDCDFVVCILSTKQNNVNSRDTSNGSSWFSTGAPGKNVLFLFKYIFTRGPGHEFTARPSLGIEHTT